MRLSTMLDSWKNSCQGATVVPMMEMMRSTALELAPPRICSATAACDIASDRGVSQDRQRNDEKVHGDEEHHESLPAAKRPRRGHGKQHDDRDGTET